MTEKKLFITREFLIALISAAVLLFTGCSDCSVLVDDTKEEVLADETVEIPASGYQSFDVTLSKSATISVELEVKDGSGVRFYTVDEAGYNAIKAGKSTFTYYESLSSNNKTTRLSLSTSVNAGHTYFVTINDNLFSAQKVYTKIIVKR